MARIWTIEDMQALASRHGGKCLSDNYVNMNTHLLWKCREGHQWRTMPKHVVANHWCKKCSAKTVAEKKRKYTITDMQEFAQGFGGKCLSKIYLGMNTHLLWECAEGHQWRTMPKHVKDGHWCKKCSAKVIAEKVRKYTLADMQEMAKKLKGECLSTTFKSVKVSLLWQCSEGHEWFAPADRIMNQKSWCPTCRGPRQITIEEMHEVAHSRGGKCLSDEYINYITPMKWRCKYGHQWKTKPRDILGGTWCPDCGGKKKLNIEKMHKIAEDRGGKCLSTVYTNGITPLEWECEKGHNWQARPVNVIQGTWCPECSPSKPLSLNDMIDLAESRGGKCLSNEYINAQTHLEWECAEGHTWTAVPNMVKQGTWCPECAAGLGERICRVFFEQLFNAKFPKAHPKWLKSEIGYVMELDGYSKELKLAFEHQGEQHYSTDIFFSGNDEDLAKIQARDELKLKLCANKGVNLIVIPEVPRLVSIKNLKNHIKQGCILLDVEIPINFDEKEVNLSAAYSKNRIEYIKLYAEQRGWKCLSYKYLGPKKKLEWECEKGHRWFSTYPNIRNRKYCPDCYVPYTILDMQNIASEKNGKCLSKEYIYAHKHLLWECEKGHQWSATPANTKRGHWCPVCARFERGQKRRLGIKLMGKIANEKGGRCLSNKYVNARTHLEWECAEGHRWRAIPDSVKRGHWCKICSAKQAGEKRRSIVTISYI